MGSYEVRTQIYLSREQYQRLKRRASLLKKSIAELTREAINSYLEIPMEGCALSANDPIWDIVGEVDTGCGDLSETHDKYLYGWERKG